MNCFRYMHLLQLICVEHVIADRGRREPLSNIAQNKSTKISQLLPQRRKSKRTQIESNHWSKPPWKYIHNSLPALLILSTPCPMQPSSFLPLPPPLTPQSFTFTPPQRHPPPHPPTSSSHTNPQPSHKPSISPRHPPSSSYPSTPQHTRNDP